MAAVDGKTRSSSWVDDVNDDDDDDTASLCCEDSEQEQQEEEEASKAYEACCVGRSAPGVDDKEALSHRPGPNTGPKGVLADHRAHQRAVYEQAARAKAHREAVLRRIACGVEAEQENDEADEEDDLFLRRYRQQRLQELTAAATSTDPPSAAPRPASFGTLEAAHSGPELLRLLEQAHAAGAPAVVHVHAPHSATCRAINEHLAALAPGQAGTRFLTVPGGSLAAFDAATLPLLIVYDGKGQVADSLPCVDVALGKDGGEVEREDVAWWLAGVGVLL